MDARGKASRIRVVVAASPAKVGVQPAWQTRSDEK
jgi:hypothetical protein